MRHGEIYVTRKKKRQTVPNKKRKTFTTHEGVLQKGGGRAIVEERPIEKKIQ